MGAGSSVARCSDTTPYRRKAFCTSADPAAGVAVEVAVEVAVGVAVEVPAAVPVMEGAVERGDDGGGGVRLVHGLVVVPVPSLELVFSVD